MRDVVQRASVSHERVSRCAGATQREDERHGGDPRQKRGMYVVCRESHTQIMISVHRAQTPLCSVCLYRVRSPNQRSGSAVPALAGALAAAAPELLRSTSLVSASWMFSSSSRFIREKSAAI